MGGHDQKWTTVVLFSQSFYKEFSLGKSDPKIRFFYYFEKFCHWFLLETYFNKNCSEFDSTGRNLEFTRRFWISSTDLSVTMNSFTITERNLNQWPFFQWICDIQIMWKLPYLTVLKIIRFELFEHWTMVILFLFLILIFSIWVTIKPSNLRKFYSQIWKNMIKPPSLPKGSYKISLVRQSICLSVRWSVTHFS